MVLWGRLRQSRFKFHVFSNEFKRFYNLNPAPALANQYSSSRKFDPVLIHPKINVQNERLALFQKVRFYARPLKKIADRDDNETRLNEEIMAPTVRLVIDEGNHCIVSRHEALTRAKSLKLDLVEVDKNGKPPVCKIFDFNKQKYLQQTKEKERTKSKSTLRSGAAKEIRFGGKIKLNDLKNKADAVKRLMEKGYRVKCTATDAAGGDFKTLLSQFTALIDDVALVESAPKHEQKQAYIVVRHVKYGPAKSGKKASADNNSSQASEDSDEDDAQANNAQTNESISATYGGDDSADPIFDIEESSRQETHYSVDRNVKRAVEPPPARTAAPLPTGIPKPAVDPRSAYPPRVLGMNQLPNIGVVAPPRMRPGQQAQVPKQGSSGSSDPNTPPKSYGIFSMPKVNTTNEGKQAQATTNRYQQKVPNTTNQGQQAPATTNRYQQRVPNTANQGQQAPATTNRHQQKVPSDLSRNPRTTGASPQRESSADSSSDQARWGIFSALQSGSQAQKR